MPLKLPDFKGRRCVDVDLCGFYQSDDNLNLDVQGTDKVQVAKYHADDGEDVYMALLLPFTVDENHIHLRLTRADCFHDEFPDVTSTVDEFLQLLHPLLGRSLKVHIEGVYLESAARLALPIQSTMAHSISDDVKVRVVGATLDVQGSPINSLSWRLIDGDKQTRLTVKGNTELVFDESYLDKALDWLDSAIGTFIVREVADD